MTNTADSGAPSGERYIPEAMGGSLIEAEHHARYRLAAQIAAGKRVLDAGCGVGWGTQVLYQAGPSEITGLDISAEAVENARRREPGATFVEGDLRRLPFPDHSFDVVTCFEAIEHVADPLVALEELRRVVAPQGVFLVSSPNPAVYPAGNPFHLHEFPPDELRSEVGERFRFVEIWSQHAQLASVVSRGGPGADDGFHFAALTEETLDSAPYSLVVASDMPLPGLRPVVALVSSDQFTQTVAALVRVQEDHGLLTAEHAKLDAEYRRAMAETARILSENERLVSEKRELTERVAALQAHGDALERRLHELRTAEADRDRVLLHLMESERLLAIASRREAEPQA